MTVVQQLGSGITHLNEAKRALDAARLLCSALTCDDRDNLDHFAFSQADNCVFEAALREKLASDAAAFYRVTLGAPTQHAARKICNVYKTRFVQDHRGLGRAAAGTADGDDRTIARQLAHALGKFAKGD